MSIGVSPATSSYLKETVFLLNRLLTYFFLDQEHAILLLKPVRRRLYDLLLHYDRLSVEESSTVADLIKQSKDISEFPKVLWQWLLVTEKFYDELCRYLVAGLNNDKEEFRKAPSAVMKELADSGLEILLIQEGVSLSEQCEKTPRLREPKGLDIIPGEKDEVDLTVYQVKRYPAFFNGEVLIKGRIILKGSIPLG